MIRLAPVKALLVCLSSLGTVTLTLHAQPLPFGVEQFTSEEGLSSDVVSSLLVDSRGFLWIGTVDGLNRYDGTEFRIYRSDPSDSTSLSHNWVTGLSEDRAGEIWVTTFYGGLCRLNIYTDRFHCVSVSPEGELGLSTNEVYSAIEDRFRDGLLWLATDSGLYSYDFAASSLDRFGRVGPDGMAGPCRMGEGPTPCRYARDVHQDQSGMIWVGDWRVGLGRFDSARKRFRFFPEVLDRRPTASNPIVLSVYEAPSRPGIIWAGVRGGLRAVDAESGRVQYFNLPDRESVAWVHESFEDSRGRLWFGSDDGLLALSDHNASLRVAANLGEDVVVRAIVEDSGGQLWLGSWGSGLFRLDVDRMESLLFHPAGGEVRSFVQLSKGNLLVGFTGGVLVADSVGQVTGRLNVPNLIPHYLTLDQDSNLWIMTADAGLLRLDLDSSVADVLGWPARLDGVLRVNDYDPAVCAGRVARDPRIVPHYHLVESNTGRQAGRLTHVLVRAWYDDRSTAGGDGVAPRFTFRLAQHLLDDPIDRDRIWFSQRRGGVQRIDLESLEVDTWNRRSSQRLETNFVYQALATGDADLVLATRVGLFRFVREVSTFERIPLGASSAQSPISVFRVASDPARPSLLWLATSEGLLVKDLVAGSVQSFTKFDSSLESRAVHDLAFDPD
jgi:ligand-binding sensor domain-containing protein